MIERLDFDVKVFDNFIEIIPKNKVQDNSLYEIKIDGLTELHGSRVLNPTTVKFCTALTPAYATIRTINSLIDSCDIPEDIILFHIREASRYVDYIKEIGQIDAKNIPFEVEQYVKYKAAHDSLLKFYVDKVSTGGMKGQLSEIRFENQDKFPDISKLLKELKAEIKRWEDALRGYKIEGRAAPKSALRGSKANPPMTDLNLGYSRGV